MTKVRESNQARDSEAIEKGSTPQIIIRRYRTTTPLTCPHAGCGKKFWRHDRLRAHIHLHTGTQPFKCNFPGCGKAFGEKHNLHIH